MFIVISGYVAFSMSLSRIQSLSKAGKSTCYIGLVLPVDIFVEMSGYTHGGSNDVGDCCQVRAAG